MKATITPYWTTDGKRDFMIALRDDTGNTVDRIVVSEVCLVGNPWVRTELSADNRLRLVATDTEGVAK